MIREELSQAVAAANTVNNEGTRVEMKVNAAIHALAQLLELMETPALIVEPPSARVRELVREELAAFITENGEVVFRGPGANETEQILAAAAAIEAALLATGSDQGENPAEAAQEPADAAQTTGDGSTYATHTSSAPSTALYDVLPERAKLERMTKADLNELAAKHGITVPADGTKADIIDAMSRVAAGPEKST